MAVSSSAGVRQIAPLGQHGQKINQLKIWTLGLIRPFAV
jgi:hypothetical protein